MHACTLCCTCSCRVPFPQHPSPATCHPRHSKPHELVHLGSAAQQRIPLIKRFTGGGTGEAGSTGVEGKGQLQVCCAGQGITASHTGSAAAAAGTAAAIRLPSRWFLTLATHRTPAVVVDSDTIFTALVMQQQCLPDVGAYPRPIMQVGSARGRTAGLERKVSKKDATSSGCEG